MPARRRRRLRRAGLAGFVALQAAVFARYTDAVVPLSGCRPGGEYLQPRRDPAQPPAHAGSPDLGHADAGAGGGCAGVDHRAVAEPGRRRTRCLRRRDLAAGPALAASWCGVWGLYAACTWTAQPGASTLHGWAGHRRGSGAPRAPRCAARHNGPGNSAERSGVIQDVSSYTEIPGDGRPANLVLVEQSGAKHEIPQPSPGDGMAEAEQAMHDPGLHLREVKVVSEHKAIARWKASDLGWRRVA